MAIKFHRCSGMALKGSHPCWAVQRALDDAGIEYEMVRHPSVSRGRPREVIALTGQPQLPAIELENGQILREDPDVLVERIRSGRLRD